MWNEERKYTVEHEGKIITNTRERLERWHIQELFQDETQQLISKEENT